MRAASVVLFTALACASDVLPTCPPSGGASMPWIGAGDVLKTPTQGFVTNQFVETLSAGSWSTYTFGTVLLERCLVGVSDDPTNGDKLLDFGILDFVPQSARARLETSTNKLFYNYTSTEVHQYPKFIQVGQNALPAEGFGSTLAQTTCLNNVAVPPELQFPTRVYAPGELPDYPQGFAIALTSFQFVTKPSPHFIVHLCPTAIVAKTVPGPKNTTINAVEMKMSSPAYPLPGFPFTFSCILAARVGNDFVFTSPSVAQSLEIPATCPTNLSKNLTIPNVYLGSPSPSVAASSSASLSASLAASASATASVSHSFAPSPPGLPPVPGVALQFMLLLPDLVISQVTTDALTALCADLANGTAMLPTDVSATQSSLQNASIYSTRGVAVTIDIFVPAPATPDSANSLLAALIQTLARPTYINGDVDPDGRRFPVELFVAALNSMGSLPAGNAYLVYFLEGTNRTAPFSLMPAAALPSSIIAGAVIGAALCVGVTILASLLLCKNRHRKPTRPVSRSIIMQDRRARSVAMGFTAFTPTPLGSELKGGIKRDFV